ncbi:MAG: hypothetical protein Tsb0014_34370 [Pleurocapsa sp.]
MNTTTKIQKSQPDKTSTLLNPHSKDFDFELWAKEVRQQMLTVLQERFISSQDKTPKASE